MDIRDAAKKITLTQMSSLDRFSLEVDIVMTESAQSRKVQLLMALQYPYILDTESFRSRTTNRDLYPFFALAALPTELVTEFGVSLTELVAAEH